MTLLDADASAVRITDDAQPTLVVEHEQHRSTHELWIGASKRVANSWSSIRSLLVRVLLSEGARRADQENDASVSFLFVPLRYASYDVAAKSAKRLGIIGFLSVLISLG